MPERCKYTQLLIENNKNKLRNEEWNTTVTKITIRFLQYFPESKNVFTMIVAGLLTYSRI